MSLKINIATSDGDKSICDQIVIDNHSYVARAKTVGRVIKNIIHYENDVVGTFCQIKEDAEVKARNWENKQTN